jgi:methyl-accepting chemotaxis protein
VLLFFSVLALSLFIPLMVGLDSAGNITSNKSFQSAQSLLYLHEHFWLPSFLCLIAIAIHSVKTSHRIAGPMYRLNKIINSINQGVLPVPLRTLRKGDYLTEEFNRINDMLENLRTHITDVQEEHSELGRLISQTSSLSSESSTDVFMQIITDIEEKNEHLGEKIGYFNVESIESYKYKEPESSSDIAAHGGHQEPD